MKLQSYRDLVVWQKSLKLVFAVYELTDKFPKEEVFGLTSQMRRAVVSIPSNIAEGSRRGTKKDYRSFIINAFASGAELETQVIIVKNLNFGKNLDYQKIDMLLEEIMKMLNKLITQLSE